MDWMIALCVQSIAQSFDEQKVAVPPLEGQQAIKQGIIQELLTERTQLIINY
jgi:hypothetical protein